MKSTTTFLYLLTIAILLLGKPAQAQLQGTAVIDANNISARVWSNADHFPQHANGDPNFLVPKSSGLSTIYTSALWVGGLENNNIRVSAMTYRQEGTDFWAGPLVNGQTDSLTSAEWDKVWVITSSEVEEFKGEPTKITNKIKDWPAKGNKGITADMAPFVDTDGDGLYDPMKGDYPFVKGDEMAFWVFNDDKRHDETNSTPLGIEVRAIAYSFYGPLDTALHHTIFFEYDISNKSGNDYDSMYLAMFTDFDIGYPYDDYTGIDTVLNACYGYNGDNFDEGSWGYGQNPPVQSLTFLNKPITNYMVYNNAFDVTGNPTQPINYYYYMSSSWKDGSPFVIGAKRSKYMFPGDPTSATGQSEMSMGNTPGDRRGLASTYIGAFEAGSMQELNFCYTYTRRDGLSHIGNTKPMRDDIKHVKSVYAKIPTDVNKGSAAHIKVAIYPNPADEIVYINSETTIKRYSITDLSGREVIAESVNGTSLSVDVSTLQAGVYLMNINTNRGTATRKLVVNRP